mmetsp:Transcript_16505/g.37788  ORF Transcript_16505/g.37788 Transcript_16505/m.37788 type:complete len:291 (+) Transcript_16505:270-1142(+)
MERRARVFLGSLGPAALRGEDQESFFHPKGSDPSLDIEAIPRATGYLWQVGPGFTRSSHARCRRRRREQRKPFRRSSGHGRRKQRNHRPEYERGSGGILSVEGHRVQRGLEEQRQQRHKVLAPFPRGHGRRTLPGFGRRSTGKDDPPGKHGARVSLCVQGSRGQLRIRCLCRHAVAGGRETKRQIPDSDPRGIEPGFEDQHEIVDGWKVVHAGRQVPPQQRCPDGRCDHRRAMLATEHHNRIRRETRKQLQPQRLPGRTRDGNPGGNERERRTLCGGRRNGNGRGHDAVV